MAVSKVTYKLNLNKLGLSEISNKAEALKEIGEYLKTTILDHAGDLKTTVKGGAYKKSLSPAYKKFKDDFASPVPNMELSGDMLDSLDYEYNIASGTVEVGFFDYDQAQKADNHNKFTTNALATDVPARQLIPKNGRDELRPEILQDIKDILDDYRDGASGSSGMIMDMIVSNLSRK